MDNKLKRRKSYNPFGNKRQRKYVLGTGVKGFLCSCNNREKECIREAYNILNKYADQLYGNEQSNLNVTVDETGSKEHDDIDEDLKQEMEMLKQEKDRRFQVVDSGAKNFLFIRTTVENPVALVEAIVTDIFNIKKEQTRFLIRLIPVEITCKAYLDDIKKAFESLADKYFKDSSKSFSIVYNHRNNNNLSKDTVIKEIADMIMKQRTDHKVDLKNPDFSVIVEVIKGIALLSVVPNYFKYKKYNLHSICQVDKLVEDTTEESVENSEDMKIIEHNEEVNSEKRSDLNDESEDLIQL